MKINVKLKGDFDGKDLSLCTCIVPISVGQDYHEREKFFETIKFLAESEAFNHVIIVVADSLQRFTMAIPDKGDPTCQRCEPDTLRTEALRKGDEWIARNQEAINQLGTKFTGIIRWDTILQDPEVQHKLEELKILYEAGEKGKIDVSGATVFYQAVEKSIGAHAARCLKKGEKYDPKALYAELSRKYVLEETAALFTWTNIGKYLAGDEHHGLIGDFLAYPNKLNQAMYVLLKEINKEAVANGQPCILSPLTISFENVKETLSASASLPAPASPASEPHTPCSSPPVPLLRASKTAPSSPLRSSPASSRSDSEGSSDEDTHSETEVRHKAPSSPPQFFAGVKNGTFFANQSLILDKQSSELFFGTLACTSLLQEKLTRFGQLKSREKNGELTRDEAQELEQISCGLETSIVAMSKAFQQLSDKDMPHLVDSYHAVSIK